MQHPSKPVILILTLLAATLLAACGPEEDKPPPDEVTVRLKWLHGAQFAGHYVADQMGYYAEENIAVTLNQGGPEVDELLMVAAGQDDFGIVSADQIIVGRDEAPSLVALAVIYRKNPSVYFALKESGITKPQNLVGRRVLVFPTDFRLPAMLARVGVDMTQVEAIAPGVEMEAFYNGDVEVWTGYLTNQVTEAREKGYEVNVIYPDDYGVHFYSDTIITSKRMIEAQPELVERFLRATLRGWRYAIENPAEAAAITLRYDESLDKALTETTLEASVPLIHTGQDQIGWMKPEVWQGMHDILLEQELLDEPMDVSQMYTLTFLRRVYGAGE